MKTKPKSRVLLEATSGDDVPKSPASRTAAIASIEETCVVADVRENWMHMEIQRAAPNPPNLFIKHKREHKHI